MSVLTADPLFKAPSEVLPMAVDFEPWLRGYDGADDDELATVSSVTASPSGLTLGSGTITGTLVKFTVSGGAAGTDYVITVAVTTDNGGNPLTALCPLKVRSS